MIDVMAREIKILRGGKISKRNQKRIRDRIQQRTTKKVIEEARSQGYINLGVSKETQAKRAYAYFTEIYNDDVRREKEEAEIQRRAEQMRRQTEREIQRLQNRNRAEIFNYNDLNPDLLKRRQFRNLFRSRVGRNSPYTLTLISREVSGVSREFQFRHYNHLLNWLNKIWEENYGSTVGDYARETGLFGNEAFQTFSATIVRGAGGHRKEGDVKIKIWKYPKNKDVTRPIVFKNYRAKAIDFKETNKGDMNCGFRCLRHILQYDIDTKAWRKKLNIKAKTLLQPHQLARIYNDSCGEKNLNFIDESYSGRFKEGENYILLKDSHYTVITDWKFINHMEEGRKKYKGMLVFDIETRHTKEVVMVGEKESYILKSAILSIVYKRSRGFKQKRTFVTDRNKNCCEKFLDWLSHEANEGNYFNCVAHNGSRFDFYLLMSYFTEDDLLQSKTQLRGTSIIGLQYKSHTFKDTCCFLTDSLSNLCKGYLTTPEEKAFSKISNITLGDKTITNYQLCFYKPELDFWEFMELEKAEPDFWKEYVRYCEFDCEALYLVWGKFKIQIREIISKMGYKMGVGDLLKQRVSLNTVNTIGSLSKKLITNLNSYKLTKVDTWDFQSYKEFLGDDVEKYEFVKNFKRGGISHANQMGLHREGVTGYDIKSQYPTALTNMMIPVGNSRWVYDYNEASFGFYKVCNMEWEENYENRFKPIAHSEKGFSLNWAYNVTENYVDSYMLKYLKEHCGLKSFDVEKGLVSDKELCGDKLFNHYVMTLYELKAEQDYFKSIKDPRYNEPFRAACKLLLNSLTGKLVEDPSRYFKLKFNEGDGKLRLNGLNVLKDDSEVKRNEWLVAGVMVYSYSKRLLWDYILCLPNGANDVIHVETDGLYFGLPNRNQFIKNVENKNSGLIKIGDELGNVECEVVVSFDDSYVLGKKDYLLGKLKKNQDGTNNYDKSKLRFKGIAKTTIGDDGSHEDLLDEEFFVRRFNGETISKTFKTITKALWETKKTKTTTLAGYNLTRKVLPRNFKHYKIYEERMDGGIICLPWKKIFVPDKC